MDFPWVQTIADPVVLWSSILHRQYRHSRWGWAHFSAVAIRRYSKSPHPDAHSGINRSVGVVSGVNVYKMFNETSWIRLQKWHMFEACFLFELFWILNMLCRGYVRSSLGGPLVVWCLRWKEPSRAGWSSTLERDRDCGRQAQGSVAGNEGWGLWLIYPHCNITERFVSMVWHDLAWYVFAACVLQQHATTANRCSKRGSREFVPKYIDSIFVRLERIEQIDCSEALGWNTLLATGSYSLRETS